MRCGFLFGYKERDIHSHSGVEELTAHSAVAAALLSLCSAAQRVNTAAWFYDRTSS